MATNASFLSSAHLGLHTFEDGVAWAYVGIDRRETFDAIPLEPHDNAEKVGADDMRRVLTKALEQDGIRIVFQHWPNSACFEVKP